MSGLYVSQPHSKRLQELHALSRQLLQTSHQLSRSPYLPLRSAPPHPDILRARSAKPILMTSGSETSATDFPESISRRYTAPTAVSVILRKDSPEYLLTITSAAYKQYASTPTSVHTSACSRPRSENRSRAPPYSTQSTGVKTVRGSFSRSPLPSSTSKSPHYMKPLDGTRPFRARKYLLKRNVRGSEKPLGVFDLRDVFDASQGVFTGL